MGNGSDDDGARLRPLVMGLDGVDGFAQGSLTAPATAARRGELPFRQGSGSPTVLEMRIHGVGGATAERVLETPSTLQVSGDATAGFYRAWTPGVRTDPSVPRREAYCWGGLDYRSRTTALWQVLVAFMFLNLAHWALPSPSLCGDGPMSFERALDAVAKALLRALGVILTLTFIATSSTVLVDIVAWQGGQADDVLPSWLGWLGSWPGGPRAGFGFGAVLVVLGILYGASFAGRRYERLTIPVEPGGPEPVSWPMARPGFWHGYLTASRQRDVHVAAGAALVTIQAAVAIPSPATSGSLVGVGTALLAVAAVVAVSPLTSRDRLTTGTRTEFSGVDWALRALAATTATAALGTAVVLACSHPAYAATYPGDVRTQTVLLWTEGGGLALLALVVVASRPVRQHRPGFTTFCAGLAGPVFAALAFCVGGIFGAAVTLSVANVLGTPQVAAGRTPLTVTARHLYVPPGVYGFGFAAVATVATTAALALALLGRWLVDRRRLTDGLVRETYADELRAVQDGRADRTRRARRTTASEWALAALTDGVGRVLLTLVGATVAAVLTYDFWSLRGHVPHWMSSVSTVGSTLAVLATVWFVGRLRLALTSTVARKQVSTLWDVATFWPRACQPFAPPCYAERAVPEVVDRVRRATRARSGDDTDPAVAAGTVDWLDEGLAEPVAERQSPVLITGYSQGTVIAAAVVAQLSPSARSRVALLTLAAPLRRLYGRAFPAYFGDDYLRRDLCAALSPSPLRWRNLVRRSDFIGGWVLDPPVRSATPAPDAAAPAAEEPDNDAPDAPDAPDRSILDPSVLTLDVQIAKPALHTHFDWFQDPQTASTVELLTGLLLRRPQSPDGTAATGRTAAVDKPGPKAPRRRSHASSSATYGP